MPNSLNNISPVDGRYSKLTKELSKYFSEAGLIKYRVYIEIQYFIHLCNMNLPELKLITKKDLAKIEAISSTIESFIVL